MNNNDNLDTEFINDQDDNNVNSCASTNNTTTINSINKETIMTIPTFTLTQEQLQKVEELRLTTIANNEQKVPKTQQQQISQIVEYGIRALEQQRKQYARQRQALQLLRSQK